MNASDIQAIIDNYHYWDAKVTKLECKHFADEIVLTYETEDESISYYFYGCYNVIFNHEKNYDKLKPVKMMNSSQLPYYLQNVIVSEASENDGTFYICEINMFPLYLEIICKNIQVLKTNLG